MPYHLDAEIALPQAAISGGIERVAAYLQAQVAAGVLHVEDTEVAAAQFPESCTATIAKPILFGFGTAPQRRPVHHVVGIAVRTFLAAYRRG